MPSNHGPDNMFESHRNRTITTDGRSGCRTIFHPSRKINPCIDRATWIGERDLPSAKRCTYVHTCNLRNLFVNKMYRNDAERYTRKALLRVRRLLPAGVRVNEKKTRCTWATCLRSKARKSNGRQKPQAIRPRQTRPWQTFFFAGRGHWKRTRRKRTYVKSKRASIDRFVDHLIISVPFVLMISYLCPFYRIFHIL